jgi:hypothetical protein
MNHLPPSRWENLKSAISNFFEYFQRYSKVKVGLVDTVGKFGNSVILTTRVVEPMANLPRVSKGGRSANKFRKSHIYEYEFAFVF